MSDLARLVETLFTLRGFASEPSPGGHVLRFRKGKEHIAVRVREGRDPVPAFLAHEVAETLPALGHAVLVCLGDLGHEARSVLEKGGIDVWTREKLMHEVGKGFLEAAEHARLAEALDAMSPTPLAALAAPPVPTEVAYLEAAPVPPEPVAAPEPEPVLAPPPPAREPEPFPEPVAEPSAEPEPVAAPVPTPPPAVVPVAAAPPPPAPAAAATPSLWNRPRAAAVPPQATQAPRPPPAIALTATLVQVAPLPAPVPLAAPPPAAPALAAAEGTVLAAAMDRERALQVGVSRLLRVDKASLELVPLHAFRYTCRLEAKGAPAQAKKGLLAVDAVTGAVREMAEPVFGAITSPAERLQGLLPEVDAVPLARQKIFEQHTQKIRVKNSLGRNSLIVEDRMVRPDPKSLQVESQGLWWLPVWRLEGQNGALRVNAATGAIEEEKLKRAFAQDAEFL